MPILKDARDHLEKMREHTDCCGMPVFRELVAHVEMMDVLLAQAADALNARPYNNDMVLGAEISDFRAKSQQ